MDDVTKNIFDVLLGVANLIILLVGVGWAAYQFLWEGRHRPRIEFAVDASFLGPQDGFFPTQIIVRIHNKGLKKRTFESIILRIRGIARDHPILEWPSKSPRLLLPEKIIDEAEVIYKEKYKTIFVEPGVSQDTTYHCRIPDRFRFVSVRAEFKYNDGGFHSAEQLFETPLIS